MTAHISLSCDGTQATGARCHRTYLSEEVQPNAAAFDAARLGWTRRLGRDYCGICSTHAPATDPGRCASCGVPEDAHTARHPFLRWTARPAFAPRQEQTT